MERKSKKSLEDLYKQDLTSDPYRDVTLSDMADAEDPEAMNKAVGEQKKVRGYFDRLKSKLDRK